MSVEIARRFLAAAASGAASVLDLVTGAEVARASTDGPIYAVSFDSRGTRLLTAGARSDSLGRLVVWDLLDSAKFAAAFVVPDNGIMTAGFAADGRLLMTTFFGRRAANLKTGAIEDSEQTKYWNVDEILTADDSKQALFVGQEIGSTTAVVRTLAGAVVGPRFDASAVAATPDGRLLASLLFRGVEAPSRLEIWRSVGSTPSVDVESSAALVGVNGGGGDVVLRLDATRTTPSRIFVHAVDDLRRAAVLNGNGRHLVAAVNPRERVVAVGDQNTVALRRLPGLALGAAMPFAGAIQDLVFSPSGRRLGVIDSSGTISVLNDSGQVELTQHAFFEGSQRHDAAFSPSDDLLAVVAQVSGKSSLLLIPSRPESLNGELCRRLTDEPTTATWTAILPNDSQPGSCPTSVISPRKERVSLMPPVLIASTELWNDTGVHVQKGKTYELVATGVWNDASIVTDPNGYDSVNFFQRATERLRRMPGSRWFALIGALDRRRDTQFLIGAGMRYTATDDGELTCFANDLRGFYFNNRGGITLTVRESP
jgi:WD40 repeat protein